MKLLERQSRGSIQLHKSALAWIIHFKLTVEFPIFFLSAHSHRDLSKAPNSNLSVSDYYTGFSGNVNPDGKILTEKR